MALLIFQFMALSWVCLGIKSNLIQNPGDSSMNILYINDLRNLPNLGCRTTGAALEEMLLLHNNVIRQDGLETVIWSGWDRFAPRPLRFGGILPARIYKHFWHSRFYNPRFFEKVRRLDTLLGASHDFIDCNPEESVRRFKLYSKRDMSLNNVLHQMRVTDVVVINGEGTLIFSNPMMRDALYLLFIIALAYSENKPVFLLNAMVTDCPFTGANTEVIKLAIPLFAYCKIIACRDESSYHFVESLVGNGNLRFIPDALFTWGEKFRAASKAVKIEPSICIPYLSHLQYSSLDFDQPYICISGSSSSWRFDKKIVNIFSELVLNLKSFGIKIYLLEACDGDSFLCEVSKDVGVTLIPKNIPAIAAAGILAGALIYISGRYHPSIMASSNGVPCVFLSSNSHKTKTIQYLLGYEDIKEFSICPTKDEIIDIVNHVDNLITNRNLISKIIRENFDKKDKLARDYKKLIL